MLIMKDGKLCTEYELDVADLRKNLVVHATDCIISLPEDRDIKWHITIKYHSDIKLPRFTTLNASFGCNITASYNCFIRGSFNTNLVVKGWGNDIFLTDNCNLNIARRNKIVVGDNCVIKCNGGFSRGNKLTMGDNNVLIFESFDTILQNTFIKYGTGNVIIGLDGTRLNMDNSFEQMIRFCRG